MSVGPDLLVGGHVLDGATTRLHPGPVPPSRVAVNRRIKVFSNNPSRERIAELTATAEAGSIRPVIDTVFGLTDIAEVHRRLEAGGVRGKYVIDMQRGRA
ncbi:zinc-binding dehydrogenase [Amycolatopsis pigmentata]|uniref:Zinc-binding dehydrogenase n=1 Tax=Amycolatopsis pigmentata TaxID=450801 RepID=A0ABW5FYD0_9PSEU